MKIILIILFDFFVCYCFYQYVNHDSKIEKTEVKPEYNQEISERIKRIAEINEQIKAIQELITDIDLSDADNLKNISLEWNTTAGQNLSADMWIDGQSNVTEQMRILAGERLEELTTSLFDEISKLTERSKHNVSTTSAKTQKGSAEDV